MSNGVRSDAIANSGTANALSSSLTGNASNIYGSLAPELETEAAHPTGLTPEQKAAQNTAAQQSVGGSNAGAAGQGALMAARTRNAGTADAAIAKSTEAGGGALSRAALGTEQQDANLQQRNQQAGLSGLEGLYSTNLGEGEGALGLSNQALNVANNAQNPWSKLGMSALNNVVQAGTDAAESQSGIF